MLKPFNATTNALFDCSNRNPTITLNSLCMCAFLCACSFMPESPFTTAIDCIRYRYSRYNDDKMGRKRSGEAERCDFSESRKCKVAHKRDAYPTGKHCKMDFPLIIIVRSHDLLSRFSSSCYCLCCCCQMANQYFCTHTHIYNHQSSVCALFRPFHSIFLAIFLIPSQWDASIRLCYFFISLPCIPLHIWFHLHASTSAHIHVKRCSSRRIP